MAHVGSPDIYADGSAGPYRLFVTVRPPLVIPGVAEIEVRAEGGNFENKSSGSASGATSSITSIDMAPIPLTGEASKHPPVADIMKQSDKDKQFFTGGLWIMATGSWQVRFRVKGSAGPGVLSIPVPATSSSTKGMQAGLGVVLGALGLLLVVGVVGIVGAAARDARLAPGESATPSGRRRAAFWMTIALIVMIGAVVLGDRWWNVEASDYAHYVYKPLNMQAKVVAASQGEPSTLDLKIQDPGWIKSRKIDDFVLDHEHLMHLYLIRQPGLDELYHLHPEQIAPGEFTLRLPSIAEGSYWLYADVVHASGFPETLVASLDLPKTPGRALTGGIHDGDDAMVELRPVSSLGSGLNGSSCPASPVAGPVFHLPDGYTMVWDNPSPLAAKTPELFEFRLLDPAGKAPKKMALYMGMLGHAAFVKQDGSVFAHVHPSGTVSMAALMMAAAQNTDKPVPSETQVAAKPASNDDDDDSAMESMPEMATRKAIQPSSSGIPNEVGFPYGFPTAGAYRIFVQMKHDSTIETAAFDACAL